MESFDLSDEKGGSGDESGVAFWAFESRLEGAMNSKGRSLFG